MRGFDDKFLEELKNKSDIVDIAGKYVKLEQRGLNFWGRCPFHHEKTASFSINSAGQFFYCFGCHKSGDVITLIMELEALDFNDAVKFLAEKAHLPLPEIRYDDEKVKEHKKKKERLYALLKDTAMFYVNNIRGSNAGKFTEYLRKRGITQETITKFGIGASLDFRSLPKHLLSKGYTYQEMLDGGVVDCKDSSYFDSLGGRLIIPIINQFNQVIAFVGRILEKTDFAKYKNTRETLIFSKGNTLYNINNLKKLKNDKGINGIVIVEGHIDVISLVQAGIENVVASMGTALTKDQARILRRYSDRIYISYDGDFAGQKAAIRGLEILKEEGLEVKVVAMPEGLDPDDVVKKYGKDKYLELLQNAKPLIDFKLEILKRTFDINTVDGKRKFVSNAIKVIKESSSPVEQEDLLKNLRDMTGVTFEALKRELYNLPDDEQKVVSKPVFIDNSKDKTAVAGRFVLQSYLFDKPYAFEQPIEEIEFNSSVHQEIKDYILQKHKENLPLRFTDLYDLISTENRGEIDIIAGLESDENKEFDEALYFSDCVKTLNLAFVNKKIERLKKLFQEEVDVEKRRALAQEMSKLLLEKNKY